MTDYASYLDEIEAKLEEIKALVHKNLQEMDEAAYDEGYEDGKKSAIEEAAREGQQP